MRVYGDSARVCDPSAVADELAARVAVLAGRSPGLARHAALVRSLIDASERVQGLTADRRRGKARCKHLSILCQ